MCHELSHELSYITVYTARLCWVTAHDLRLVGKGHAEPRHAILRDRRLQGQHPDSRLAQQPHPSADGGRQVPASPADRDRRHLRAQGAILRQGSLASLCRTLHEQSVCLQVPATHVIYAGATACFWSRRYLHIRHYVSLRQRTFSRHPSI